MIKHVSLDATSFDARSSAYCGAVIFVGSALFFQDSMLRFVQAELGSVQILRVADARGLKEVVAVNGTPSMIVVEEAFHDKPIEDLDLLVATADGAALSMAYTDVATARRMLARTHGTDHAGLSFLPLRAQMDVWLAALRIQLCGERFVPAELLNFVQTSIKSDRQVAPVTADDPCKMRELGLTDREIEVLRLVSTGKQNKSIASELMLSEHTVKLHVHHLLSKLKVSNRTGATTWYLQNMGRM